MSSTPDKQWEAGLSLAAVLRVDEICSAFEASWQAVDPQRIKHHLGACSGLERSKLLERLLIAELELAAEAGQQPDEADYRRCFPEDATLVAGLFHKHGPGHTTGLPGRPRDGTPPPAGSLSPTLPAPSGPRNIPGYEILGELGRGGMGVVYKARQIGLKRLVALKMILCGEFADGQALARFRTEAEAVARVQHPGIVQIHEIGELPESAGDAAGLPYFSLEFVEGGSLAGKLHGQAWIPARAADIVEQLARAMHHAHQKGVVHRDLKPGNVLMTADGQPKISDFGLARQAASEGEVPYTQTGAVLGTPAYMAPEQAAGHAHTAGPAADVWALGAILYQLLAGRPPFRGKNMLDTLEQVRLKDPIPPARLNPKVHRDLETICLKCLVKEPKGRYASALALAEDLERFRAGEPILARPEGPAARLWRRIKRRPVLAALTPLVVVLVAGALVYGLMAGKDREAAARDRSATALMQEIETEREWSADHLQALEARVDEVENLAPEQRRALRNRVNQRFAAAVQSAMDNRSLQPNDVRAIETSLALLAERDGQAADALRRRLELRIARWEPVAELEAPFEGREAVFGPDQVAVDADALVPQPGHAPQIVTRLAASSHVRVEAVFNGPWNAESGVGLALNVRRGPQKRVGSLAFGPGGKTLLVGSDATVANGEALLFDVASGKVLSARNSGRGGYAVAATLDGRSMAIADFAAGCILLIDPMTGAEQRRLDCKTKPVVLAFSPDGRTLAAAGDPTAVGGWLIAWDLETYQERWSVAGAGRRICCLAVSPDGKHLASGHSDRTARLLDAATGRELHLWDGHPGAVANIAFTNDGGLITVSGVVNVRDVATKQERKTPVSGGGLNAWNRYTFSPDGKRLAAVHYGNRTLSVFDLDKGKVYSRNLVVSNTTNTLALAFDPTGKVLASAHFLSGAYPFVRLWDAADGQPRGAIEDERYSFQVRFPKESPGPARQEGTRALLEVKRGGSTLRQSQVVVPGGPLRLVAVREGDRLTFRVNDLPPLVCQDLFPLGGAEPGSFALHCPEAARLERLAIYRQASPKVANPLERGNALFAQGDFQQARAVYESQTTASGDGGTEARFKEALCLVGLKRPDEAAPLLERLAAESGRRWPLLASCQLYLLLHRQNRAEEADIALEGLLVRFDAKELIAQVPEELRAAILQADGIGGFTTYILHNPRLVRNRELALLFGDRVQVNIDEKVKLRIALLRALWVAGDVDRAHKIGQEAVGLYVAAGIGLDPVLSSYYRWLLATGGESRRALELLDRILFEAPGVMRPSIKNGLNILLHCLQERAYLNVAVRDWAAAEQDLEGYFKAYSSLPNQYSDYAKSRILQGFLLERRGDLEGARSAWQRGRIKSWRLEAPRDLVEELDAFPSPGPLFSDMMLGSLTNDFTETDLDVFISQLKKALGEDSFFVRGINLFRPSAAIFREAFQTPRGKDIARRIAGREVSLPEFVRLPFYPIGVQYVRQGAVPADLSPEQDALLWKMVEDLGGMYFNGQLTASQLFSLGLAWKGQTGFLGWDGVKGSLPANIRGPLAYVLGQRYVRVLKKPADAAKLFQTARDEAELGSPLRKLAEEELARLKK